LAKYDEISSTERLLDLIRNNRNDEVETIETASRRSSPQKVASYLKESMAFKKSTTVGVDIGHTELKLAKIKHLSHHKHQLVDYLRVPYESNVTPFDPEFVRFLRSTLRRFCGTGKKMDIWSNISSARVEIRFSKIPKVPAKQIPNAVYWSHKRLAPHNEKDTVFDYELLGESGAGGAPKLEVISFTAPKQEVQNLREMFSKSGYPLTGVAIVPFAVQNLLRTQWIDAGVKNLSSLYIGRDWSRIDIFSGGNLILSRGIKAGITTMNAAIRGELDESGLELALEMPDSEDLEGAPPVEEVSHIDAEQAQKIFYDLIHDASPLAADDVDLGPAEEEIFKLMLPALERLVRQVERTFEHFTANFENERVQKIYISSGIRPHNRIVNYIGDQLGLPRETIDPFSTKPAFLGDITGPASATEKSSFAPAMGMALSNNDITPNFLYTFKEKAKTAGGRRLGRIAVAGFILLITLCVGFFYWQGEVIAQKKSEINQLRFQLNRFQPQVDQNIILQLVDQAKKRNEIYREFSKKYLGVVVLREVSNITPSNIRLLSITMNLGGKPGQDEEKIEKKLILEGIILGDRLAFESSLAEYLIRLKESPLFDQPAIDEKSVGSYQRNEVLRFTAQLKLS
jgi:Tfp pilus assembly PilM family ATPase